MPSPEGALSGLANSMKYYVYVLRSLKDGKLYIGVTSNLKKRILQHNQGKTKSTKPRRPFKLIYYETFDEKHQAYQQEWRFKNTSEGNREMRQNAKLAKMVTARD